jgi:site-specific DNA-methyltransferase (cytosine-N4-specific)
MNQTAPALPLTGVIDVRASPKSQQRGAHGAFRYFGKLAPDVTGAVLDVAAGVTRIDRVVDPMCGSGTTLLEAVDRGWAATGVDANPVAALYARVKTTPLDRSEFKRLRDRVLAEPAASSDEIAAVFGATRNAERWFSPAARRDVATLRGAIGGLIASPERDALLAALLGRLRRISNASARTGRIFFDPPSALDAIPEFEAAAEQLVAIAPETSVEVTVVEGDARSTSLADDSFDLTFCHPPYFALYRYSADVLRFELEIGGFSRRNVNKREVREGWKSGDVANLDHYVSDMAAVFVEASRITRAGGALAVVVSNSTLGDVQLPVIDRLAESLGETRWEVLEHLERPAHFGSAKYHRSARPDKVISRDHVLVCRQG